MREKLQLLSRTTFSPPNPKVSGGSPHHHGGSLLLHHGGSLLHHGGSTPPHWLGFATKFLCRVTLSPIITHLSLKPSLLFLHLPLSLTETPPNQHPNPLRAHPLGSPSPSPHPLFSSALQRNHHHHNTKSLLQTNLELSITAAVRSPTILVPLSGALFLPPQPTIAPSTTPPRSPPEPPPSDHVADLEKSCAFGCFWSSNLSHLRLSLELFLFTGLVLIRPPLKPHRLASGLLLC